MLENPPLALTQPAAPGGRTISDVQREKLLCDTGLTALKYAEARGEVLPIGGERGIEQATREIGDAFRQAVGRLHMRAAEAVAVGAKDGVIGMRALLKSAERDYLAIAGDCAGGDRRQGQGDRGDRRFCRRPGAAGRDRRRGKSGHGNTNALPRRAKIV
jgi:hypothetical protein